METIYVVALTGPDTAHLCWDADAQTGYVACLWACDARERYDENDEDRFSDPPLAYDGLQGEEGVAAAASAVLGLPIRVVGWSDPYTNDPANNDWRLGQNAFLVLRQDEA